MKRNLILFATLTLSICAFAQQQDPVMMRINNKDVTRSEFEYIYNKNNSNNELDKKTLDEYVDLFVNFKLKVVAAQEAGIDTTQAFRDEFLGYRKQLTKSYLTDDTVNEANAMEVYNRLKENVDASHILIMVKQDASDAAERAAYDKAMKARKRILKGEDFGKVAREMSEDPSAKQNGGHLGFFTAMQMVYPFEVAAYGLKVGEVSEPVRSDFGYHVIKVNNRRADIGKVLVAHIFKYIPQDASKEVEQEMTMKLDSAYTALKGGADFAELAKSLSDDKSTASRGGELPWIGPLQTVKEFEDVAFSLKKGEYSKPFRSVAGMHIVKLIDHKDIEPFAEKKDEILRRLSRMGKGNEGTDSLIARLKKEYNYSVERSAYNEFANLAQKNALGDSLFMVAAAPLNKTLLTLNGKAYAQSDFAEYLKANRPSDLDDALTAYSDKIILAYEDGQLENKYPDFGHLMQEYRDGILLFEISNRLVWEKASKDEEGLAKFFKENKSDYAWKTPRFKGIILHSKDAGIAKQAKKLTKKSPIEEWSNVIRKAFNNDSVSVVKVEKGLYAKGDNKYVDKLVFKAGSYEPLAEYPYTSTLGKKLKKGPESYKDVRGPVTADYQNFLESVWIKELRGKYKVEINQEVLKTVNNH
ncbi:MAG: peptidylprolyl isomerase [Bacteroidaceae bacterium]